LEHRRRWSGSLHHQSIQQVAFLHMVEDSSGLLVQKESGIYGFIHLTFQEYMASVHVKEERLLTELISRVNQTWWHETARLYSAQTDASPIAYSSGFTCSIRPEQSENCTGWDRNSDYSLQSVIRNAGLAPVFLRLTEYKQG
jgi:hypothetical protein